MEYSFNIKTISNKYNIDIKKILVLTLIILAFIILFLFWSLNLVINTTKSMPLGMYQISNEIPKKNDLIIFRIPQKSQPLLKKIIAATGDKVIVNENGIYINGTLEHNSTIYKFDTNNNSLSFKNINQVLKKDEIFVKGKHSRSFDSRYFGIINTKKIQIKKVNLIFSWSNNE